MGKYLWLAVTADKYETPLYVADTARELAEKFGVTTNTIVSYVARSPDGRQNGYRYVKVRDDE